jgi:CubicO group peptidase (beta-lactamase class C family)
MLIRFVASLLVLALCWLPKTLVAAEAGDAIDAYLEDQIQTRHIPGLSLAIVKDGKVVKAQGYGVANIKEKTPATADTVYQLASATKPFTATAVMLLVQDGKIDLEAKIGSYLDGLPATWGDVRVRHLLSHTSGIPSYLRSPNIRWEEPYTPARIVEAVAGAPLDFAPGEKWEYSNTGFVLLAMIVQKVTGKTYDAFLAERVFEPLGMTATRRDDPAAKIPNRATEYQWENGKIVPAERLNPTLWNNGDGGLVSTVLDLAKFDAALAEGKLLKEATLVPMWTAAKVASGFDARTMFEDGYGYGWFLDSQRGHRLVWHSGGRPGAVSVISRFVDDRLTVIILANRDGWNPIGISRVVAGLYEPALTAPSKMLEAHDSDAGRAERMRQVLTELATGTKDEEWMTAGACGTMDVHGDAELADILNGATALTFIGDDDVTDRRIVLDGVPVARLSYWKLTGRERAWWFTYYLMADGKVALVQWTRE